jgi:hypothetical protein
MTANLLLVRFEVVTAASISSTIFWAINRMGGFDLIFVAQDRDKWRALLNVVN